MKLVLFPFRLVFGFGGIVVSTILKMFVRFFVKAIIILVLGQLCYNEIIKSFI